MFCDCKSNEIIISKINANKLLDLSNAIDIIIYFVVVKIYKIYLILKY